MTHESASEKIIGKFELVAVHALQYLLVLSVAIATVVLYLLVIGGARDFVSGVETVDDVHTGLQRVFGGVLIVLLGLELLETLRIYFAEHRIRVELILIVALIAVSRHVIQVDFAHAEGLVLLGLAAVIVSLALGYFLVRQAHVHTGGE